ncbi:hypothetical protein A4G99_18895 [Haladaptatus sp. R4]|uniref:hypothetical protein n=1 Tax=Haladaptatus sp. R4 TaxID=1679489 RepID=UPI0007B45DA9|nr:hypothetical protein [Haladaptatus sp. R4]KZN22540.1 hypothetical protein A4G99_18895 [Haladaptatus sp. R4]
MPDPESDTVQLQFDKGSLVKKSPEGAASEEYTAEPITPGDRIGFTVEVKDNAIAVNSALSEVITTHDRTLDFGSRAHAEAYASQLSAGDGSLRIQAAPVNDPRDVDAYLLADHTPSISEPAATDGKTWTFDVGANLYGALGEAILTGASKPHALYYFVREDLEFDDGDIEFGLVLEVERGTPISVAHPDGEKRWTPDCIVRAKDGWDGCVLSRYYCEIKTGNASFERSQGMVMEELAAQERVLKIRVRIENLPEQYSLRINEVTPAE